MTEATSAGRRSLVARIGALAARRELLFAFTRREVQVRYKQALLGMAWAVFMPLAMMLIWTLVKRQLMGEGAPGPVHPALVLYAAFLVWTMHQTALKGCTNTLVTNKNLLSKVYFPREIFPLAKILAATVDFFVGLVVLFGLMAWFGNPFHPSMLLLPVALAVHLLLLMGVGFLLSAANLFFRDVQYVFDVFVLLWMFASPVLVDRHQMKEFAIGSFDLFRHGNPMHPVIVTYQDVLLYGEIRDPGHFLYGAAFAAVLFVVGFLVFAKTEPRFAERV